MTSTVRTVSRQVVRRPWTELDPKVAVLAIITLIAWAVLIALYAAGQIPAQTLAAGLGPSGLGTLAAYLRTSSHSALVEEGARALDAVAADAPAVLPLLPAAAQPAAEAALSGVDAVREAFEVPAGSPSTAPLTLSATGGGQ